ncbi:MAG: hypothetical protein ACRBCL_15290 [Maritimibacter sp.]
MISKIQAFTGQVDKKRIYTAGATLVAALATGYMMQRGESPAPASAPQVATAQMQINPQAQVSFGEPDTPADLSPAVLEQAPEQVAALEAGEGGEAAQVQSPVLANASDAEATKGANATDPARVIASLEVAAPAREEVMRTDTDAPSSIAPATPTLEPVEPAGLANTPAVAGTQADECLVSMSGAPIAGAMVMMNFEAPCNGGEDVLFTHAGLRFTEQLDASGTMSLIVPAMMEDVTITAEFADGSRASSQFTVPEASQFDRVALIWQGGTGLQLHALENGDEYGDEGHVWAENPRLPVGPNARDGGFLSVLGSSKDGFAADVYSYPSRTLSEPDISIEAQVLETTCGTSIQGEYLRSQKNAPPVQTEVGMYVPACEAVGDFLVLKNLPQELKIARN